MSTATPSTAKVIAKPATKTATAKASVTKPAAKPATKTTAKPASKPASKPAQKAPAKPAAKVTKKPVPTALPKPEKVKKPKMVRDSFTMPKAEFAVIDTLKIRAAGLKKPVKKTELLRAGIKALAAMSDATFLAAVTAVPNIKTGRPSKA